MFAVPMGNVRLDPSPVRYPPDLVRYVRTEFGDTQPHWLVSKVLAPGGRKSGKALRRLAKWFSVVRRTAKNVSPTSGGPSETAGLHSR